ncbi:MAG: chorismate lyase [Methylophilaceae bacterium]|nr:chorismate lyase [Methylophilaceae bacterium]
MNAGFPHRLDPYWRPRPTCIGPYRRWLIDKGSLTRRLQIRCARFNVAEITQHWAHPLPDESRLLHLRRGAKAWIREVKLRNGETDLVFARSILPRASLNGPWRKLRTLGGRPLGAVLFGDARVKRFPLSFCKLSERHPIARRIGRHGLWARRSVFMRNGRAILVTEVFLPGLMQI